jgi:pimeloyl-ACP methyl ester carboxylesterase
MSAKLRRIIVLIILAGIIADQYWHHHQQAPGHRPAATALAKPDVLRIGTLTLQSCAIGNRVDDGLPTISAYCNDFKVPEDWSTPAGRQIVLKVAVLRAETDKASTDLVTFLDGGPGGAATEDYAAVEAGINPLRQSHHILLIDQRGTGGSNPLNCEVTKPEKDDARRKFAGNDSNAAAIDAMKACLAKLETRAAPQFYSTSDAIRDLEAVRVALGSPKLDLIGVSYGTRVAQQYLGHYPDAVRSVVLDGPVPNRLILLSEHARNLENALQAQFARCQMSPICSKTYGDPYATLYRVRNALRAHPQTIDVRDPVSFASLHLTLTADDLASVVRFYAYSPITAALLPLMLQQADQGNYGPLLGQKKWLADDLADHLASGVEASIICAEDADLLTPRPEDDATLLGSRSIAQTQKLCQLWPHEARPENFHAPLVSAVPTLVLAGELDPVTPPSYGAEIVRNLGNALLLTAAGQGHSVIDIGCMPRLVNRFIETLDVKTLDSECLNRLGSTPAYIGYNGAAP